MAQWLGVPAVLLGTWVHFQSGGPHLEFHLQSVKTLDWPPQAHALADIQLKKKN